MRPVYNLLLLLALPFVWLRLLVKAGRDPAYAKRRGERFGRVPASVGRDVVWFHTVSAGEAIGAAPVIRALKARMPQAKFLVTTMTPTGSEQVSKRLGDIVDHCYAPYDFPWAVTRFVRRVEPRALILMETELWPNIIRGAKSAGACVALVNARLSERSARGYGRIAGLVREMLADTDHIICQYEDTAKRFEALGAERSRLVVTGNIKFDLDLPDDLSSEVDRMRRDWGSDRPVWIAGSTHPGEDEIVLDAHAQLIKRFADLLLVLVPRHPDRADGVAELCGRRGLSTARLGAGAKAVEGNCDIQVLVADVMGRLLTLYGIADVALLGGSFVAIGGHNPIEAAVHGIPMLMGPHRFNFDEVARRFADAGCLHEVNQDNLAATVASLLGDPPRCAREGRIAREVVDANRGSSDVLVARLESILR